MTVQTWLVQTWPVQTWPVQTWPVQTWPCPTCGEDRLFEQPPCADGHTEDDGECPEWVCTDCGGAFLLGGFDVVVPAVVRRAA